LIKFASVDAGIEWLTVEQIARLVDVTRHARDRFLVLLLWCTGIRIGEALGLHREDMHLLTDSQSLGCPVKGPHASPHRQAGDSPPLAADMTPGQVKRVAMPSRVASSPVSNCHCRSSLRVPSRT
jgi:integrase/recombinase XerD